MFLKINETCFENILEKYVSTLSLKKHQIWSKMGQNGSPEAKNLFPGVFWHGDFSFDTPR